MAITTRALSFLFDISGSNKPIRQSSKQRYIEYNIGETTSSQMSMQQQTDEFITYNDIKTLFDEIDEKYSSVAQNVGMTAVAEGEVLKNCEMSPPLMESIRVSSSNDDVFNCGCTTNAQSNMSPNPAAALFINMALSFCIEAEAHSDLQNESNYVLLSDYIDFIREGDERVFDEEFEIL